MNENALAIFDMAMKISQSSPTDVFVRYSPHVSFMSVDIHRRGWNYNFRADASYDVPVGQETSYGMTDPDEMLRILEEIWEAQAKEEIA